MGDARPSGKHRIDPTYRAVKTRLVVGGVLKPRQAYRGIPESLGVLHGCTESSPGAEERGRARKSEEERGRARKSAEERGRALKSAEECGRALKSTEER